MQIALQDIRTLGYKKIAKFFLEDVSKFFEDLQYLNNLYYNMKIPAYSLLNKWTLVDNNLSEEAKSTTVRGYYLFVNSLEPLICLEEVPSCSAKRKCRNMWSSIWNNFGLVSNIEGYQITLLKDFGLKALFIFANYNSDNEDLKKLCFNMSIEDDNLYSVLLRVLDFYNIILTWSVFSQQESNFTKNNLSFVDVLCSLVVDNKDDFKKSLSNIY